MALELKVPSMNSEAAAKDIRETILTSEPNARININLDDQTVTVESKASEETIKQLVTGTGHQIVG